MTGWKRHGLALATLAVLSLTSRPAPAASEEDALFAAAERALAESRPNEAVAGFEALADRGVLDAAVSFDRALAYAQKVKLNVESPGDLGQAAHGFEEAKELTRDPKIKEDAQRALDVLRAEVARRRARAGESVDLEKAPPLGRAIVRLLPERVWAGLALGAGLLLGVALFVRDLARVREARLGANVALALFAPLLLVTGGLTLAARHERRTVRDAVVVVPAARLVDERGIALATGAVVPEAARVSILATRGTLLRVLWGGTEGWIQAATVRPLASPEGAPAAPPRALALGAGASPGALRGPQFE